MIHRLPKKSPRVQIHLLPADLPLLIGDRRQAWTALNADFPDREFDYYLEAGFTRGSVKLKADF